MRRRRTFSITRRQALIVSVKRKRDRQAGRGTEKARDRQRSTDRQKERHAERETRKQRGRDRETDEGSGNAHAAVAIYQFTSAMVRGTDVMFSIPVAVTMTLSSRRTPPHPRNCNKRDSDTEIGGHSEC